MLSQQVIEALRHAGIEKLSRLQEEAVKRILEGRNLLIIAPTGSGKTEAAITPLLQRMINEEPEGIALLYITPLRALNRDMLRRLRVIAEKLGFKIAVRHGDTSQSERYKQSKKPPHILVTTPETLQILFLGKHLRKSLKNVKYVVVDEVHELADSERGVQLSIALERLREITNFQVIGLSATISDPRRAAAFLGRSVEVIEGGEEKLYQYEVIKPELCDEDSKLAEELFVDAEIAAQLRHIKEIVEKHTSALIFVNTRQTAEALGLKLKKLLDVEVHHGSLSKEARIESENRFARGDLKALICTSSMELGIDIGHVDIVIQYNSPRQVSRLIQRVGRSGHKAGRISKGCIIASNFDEILESWVITKRAEEGLIEEETMHVMSLDTLANQIAAIALEYGRISTKKAYSIIRRAYPYRGLSYEKFVEICEFLANGNVIVFDGEEIAPLRKTRRYFYENISMIPDEKHYRVVDITTGKTIGVLDESFLSTFSGEVFAMKGELWRVVAVDEVVKVEPVAREGDIPSWVGEEIPVPYEVAQDVGLLRIWIANMLRNEGREETIKALMEKFRTNRAACVEVVNVIEEHIKNFEIPSDRHLTIESSGGVAIINACFGHRVNETLGRVVAMLLSARKGTSVAVEIDPYRIKLSPARAEEIRDVLLSIESDAVEWLAERALIDTRLLQWKVVNAARKFGYLSKDTDLSRMNLRNLVLRLKDTPIYREAVREIFVERFDVERVEEIVSKLGSEISISVYSSLSPISLVSRQQAFDLLMPSKPTEAILAVFKRRLDEEFCILHCLNCRCTVREKVGSIEEVKCIRCGSKLVACVNARRRLEEYKKEELFRIANLVMSYGKKAVYAMNTHGVGAENAARILAKYYANERDFFLELLEAEKRYIRTRKFWS